MRVVLEDDERKVLPIPYRTVGEKGRRFWNVKRDPRLLTRISELQDCPELRAFVRDMNRPASGYATLGCAQWTKIADHGEGATHEAGLYVDVVFDRLETAARRANYLEIVARMRERAAGARGPGGRLPVSVVRLQPQRVCFTDLGPGTVWMLSVWIFGAGASKAVARARRRRGLERVHQVCRAVGRRLGSAAGNVGTPIPP